MLDHFGHEGTVDLSYKPRHGEWMLVDLVDPAKKVALVEAGAHASRGGSLVCIYQGQRQEASTLIERADGGVEVTGDAVAPAMFVIVDNDGNNLPMAVRGANGHMDVRNVCIHADSPQLRDIRPLRDLADMPPGRVIHPDWRPGGVIAPPNQPDGEKPLTLGRFL